MLSIVAQRYDADGSLDGAEILVASGTQADGYPVTVSLGGGRFAVVWGQQQGQVNQVRAAVIGEDRQPVSGIIEVGAIDLDTIFGVVQPRVTALADGFVITRETVVSYDDVRFFGGSDLNKSSADMVAVLRVFDRDGNPRSGEIVAEMNPSQTPIGSGRAIPSFVALPDGGFPR